MGLFTIIRILGKENTKVDRNTTNRETLNYATQEETMRSLAKGVARKLTKILKSIPDTNIKKYSSLLLIDKKNIALSWDILE